MRHSFLCGAVFLGLTALAVAEPSGAAIKSIQPPPGGPVPAPEPAPIIKLAVTVGATKVRALKYTLLPDPLDLTPGNAAPLWIRAGDATDAPNRRLIEGKYKGRGGPAGTPQNFEGKPVALKDLPKEEIRAYLANFATALRLADQAAHCDHCDWELPPLKLQDFDFPLDDIQHLRTHRRAPIYTMSARTERSEIRRRPPYLTDRIRVRARRRQGQYAYSRPSGHCRRRHHVRPRRRMDADARFSQSLLGAHRSASSARQHRPGDTHRTHHDLPLLPTVAPASPRFR